MRFLHPGRIGIWSVGFREGRKMKEPREKVSKQSENQQQTRSTYWTGAESNPCRHCWEASAVTTAPFVLPNCSLFDYVSTLRSSAEKTSACRVFSTCCLLSMKLAWLGGKLVWHKSPYARIIRVLDNTEDRIYHVIPRFARWKVASQRKLLA